MCARQSKLNLIVDNLQHIKLLVRRNQAVSDFSRAVWFDSEGNRIALRSDTDA